MKAVIFTGGRFTRFLRVLLCLAFTFSIVHDALTHSALAKTSVAYSQGLSAEQPPADDGSSSNVALQVDCATHGCWSLRPTPSPTLVEAGKSLPAIFKQPAVHAAYLLLPDRPPRG